MQFAIPLQFNFSSELLNKYDRPVPRYTSYPPATELKDTFDEVDFRAAIAVGNHKKNAPYLCIAIFLL